ncbi:MAG: efflux RND transporter periplasmic adaptor subunit [Bacteroidales bacterium]|nr:efflux RND transporter periplasmic adaptor subunit [Bacteroidales bacterium]
MKFRDLFSVAFTTALILGATACKEEVKEQTPPEYATITIKEDSVTVKNSFPATIGGNSDAEIRSNVSGFVVKINVSEGDMVKKGDVLFEVDHEVYQAQYNTALAQLHVAEAKVETARLTAQNKANLAQKGIISEYEKKLADNSLAQAEAELEQARAMLDNSRTNLDYTYIKSPSDGVIGNIPVSLGNLVSPTTAEPLTIVSDISKVYANFSIDEKFMLFYTEQGGINDILKFMPKVELKLATGQIYNEKGTIETISGMMDTKTGSAKMSAMFENPKQLLRSGNTGSVLIPKTISNAILVPQTATYELQDKKFVYVLNDSNMTVNRQIEVEPLTFNQNYIVTNGLKVGDRIVVEGVGSSVKNNMKITPITKEQSEAKLNAIAK